MSNKNYFENISARISFIAKYFRVFRLLAIIAYLIYLETLVVSVFSIVEYVPSVDEVKAKFSPIAPKNEVINSIERYFFDKENDLAENLRVQAASNPFSSYNKTKEPVLDNAGGFGDSSNNVSENSTVIN